mgnify:FL=1
MSRKENNVENAQKSKSGFKIFLRILLALLIIIVIFVLSALGGSWWFLNNKLDKVQYVNIPEEDIEVNEGVEENLEEYRNILLLGLDSTSFTGSRSDCIILVTINNRTKNVKLTSIYRDSYLDINNYGLDKITHAYAYGGPALSMSSINKNLDLNIKEFATVNFDTVVSVVDAVGGVQIPINSEEVKYINTYIKAVKTQLGRNSSFITTPGTYTLDGVQALAYSRIRYTDGGDYKRTERMRDVLTAVFAKAKTKSIPELNSLLDTLLPHVYTNISKDEIISLLPQAASYNVTDSIGWPYEVKGITLDRWYGVPVTLEQNVKKLHEQVFGETDYTVSDTVKSISNKIINKTGYNN